MAMKCRGTASITNYSQDDYMSLYPRLQKLSKVQSLSCFRRRTPLAQGMRYLTSYCIALFPFLLLLPSRSCYRLWCCMPESIVAMHLLLTVDKSMLGSMHSTAVRHDMSPVA